MKKKIFQTSWVYAALLIMLLPFIRYGMNIATVLAETTDQTSNQPIKLFDTVQGIGTLEYKVEENDLQWTLKMDQKATVTENQFQLSLKQKNQSLEVKNIQVSPSGIDYESDQTTKQLIEKNPSANARQNTITFETAKANQVTVTPSIIEKNGVNATDLLKDQKPIELTIATESSSTSTTSSLTDTTTLPTTDSSEITTTSTTNKVELGDKDDATFESAKKEADQRYKETGQAQEITRSAASSDDQPSYANKVPDYITDNKKGIYPKFSWSPDDSVNVINHQGGTDQSASWDGISKWDGDPSNLTNSYMNYGGDGTSADFAIRKYAQETNSPGLFDVYLNVRGNTQKIIKPIDIMLVVDWSGSMNANQNSEKTDRIGAVKKGINSFVDTLDKSGASEGINIGYEGFSSEGNSYKNGMIPINSFDNVKDAIKNFTPDQAAGGTFTQKALQDAGVQLKKNQNGHKKVIVLITDGVPTFIYQPTSVKPISDAGDATEKNGEQWFVDEGQSTTKIIGKGNTSDLSGLSKLPRGVTTTFPSTIGAAVALKKAGIEIHSLGIQLGGDPKANLTKNDIEDRMKQIATKNSSGVLYYEEAESAQDIADYLSTKAVQIVGTVVGGKISDPIGSQFSYVPDSLGIKNVGKVAAILPRDLQQPSGDNLLSLNNINLGKDQEIQLHYQVRIKTEDSDFVPEKWYQMNGETTLIPNQNNPENKVDFGVPSAKAPGVKLNIKKNWQDGNNFYNLRPQSLTFDVSRTPTKSTGVASEFSGSVSLDASGESSWTKTNIEKVSDRYLPKFNNSGQDFDYTVTEETVSNYDMSPAVGNAQNKTENDPAIFNNVLNVYGLEVTKIDNVTKDELQGATFSLGTDKPTQAGSAGSISLDSNKEGKLVFASDSEKTPPILPGTTYYLWETKAPDNYQLANGYYELSYDKNQKVWNVSFHENYADQGEKISTTTETADGLVKLQFSVENKAKVPLPSTGGSGTLIYTVVGLVGLTITGGYFIYRRNRKEVA